MDDSLNQNCTVAIKIIQPPWNARHSAAMNFLLQKQLNQGSSTIIENVLQFFSIA